MDLLDDEFDEQIRQATEESIRHYNEVELPRLSQSTETCAETIVHVPPTNFKIPQALSTNATRNKNTTLPHNAFTEQPSTSRYDDQAPLLHTGDECSGFHSAAGSCWIYPTNYPERKYQYEIVQTALFHNTLVSLPTGLGKTFIAAVVMYNFYRWYPQGKIVFLAPTKPLVNQQIEACYNIMGIPRDMTAEMTGTVDHNERRQLWSTKRVFFMTPQTITNDLTSGICPAHLVKCVVIDEAHKAQKNYSYVQFVKSLAAQNKNFRILALSATPGKNLDTYKEVVKNLLIARLEIRAEDMPDVSCYMHKRIVDAVVVSLGEPLSSFRARFLAIIDTFAQTLRAHKLVYSGNMTQFGLLSALKTFQQRPPHGFPQQLHQQVMAEFYQCISLCHASELLYQNGLRIFYNKMMSTLEDPSKRALVSRLNSNKQFLSLMDDVKDYLGDDIIHPFDPDVSAINPTQIQEVQQYRVTHPKMERLREIVVKHFRARGENSKVIIFCIYRDAVNEIHHILEQYRPLVKSLCFFGQSSGANQKGLHQQHQLRIMGNFRSGHSNTLISTSVGEEGLDIGEVDLIVCYDAQDSPIRLVQRMGRTGRKRDGRVVQLLTQGLEENKYKNSKLQSVSINKKILNPKALHEFFYKQNPPMIPPGMKPLCSKLHMTVAPPLPVAKKSKKSGDLRTMLGRKQEAANKVRPVFASSDELEAMGWNGTVPEYNSLPETEFLATKYSRNEFISLLAAERLAFVNEELTPDDGLGKWIDWQRSVRCSEARHSTDTDILINLLQVSEEIYLPQPYDMASQVSASVEWPSRKKAPTKTKKQPKGKKKREEKLPDDVVTNEAVPPNDIRTMFRNMHTKEQTAPSTAPAYNFNPDVLIVSQSHKQDQDINETVANILVLLDEIRKEEGKMSLDESSFITQMFAPKKVRKPVDLDSFEIAKIADIAGDLWTENFKRLDANTLPKTCYIAMPAQEDKEARLAALYKHHPVVASVSVVPEQFLSKLDIEGLFDSSDEEQKQTRGTDIGVEHMPEVNSGDYSDDNRSRSPSLLLSHGASPLQKQELPTIQLEKRKSTDLQCHSPATELRQKVSPILRGSRRRSMKRNSPNKGGLDISSSCLSEIYSTQARRRLSAVIASSLPSRPEQPLSVCFDSHGRKNAARFESESPILGSEFESEREISYSNNDNSNLEAKSPIISQFKHRTSIFSKHKYAEMSPIQESAEQQIPLGKENDHEINHQDLRAEHRTITSRVRKSLTYGEPLQLNKLSSKVHRSKLFSSQISKNSNSTFEESRLNLNARHFPRNNDLIQLPTDDNTTFSCNVLNENVSPADGQSVLASVKHKENSIVHNNNSTKVENSYTVAQILYKLNGTEKEDSGIRSENRTAYGVEDDLFLEDDDFFCDEYAMTQEYLLKNKAAPGNTVLVSDAVTGITQLADNDNQISAQNTVGTRNKGQLIDKGIMSSATKTNSQYQKSDQPTSTAVAFNLGYNNLVNHSTPYKAVVKPLCKEALPVGLSPIQMNLPKSSSSKRLLDEVTPDDEQPKLGCSFRPTFTLGKVNLPTTLADKLFLLKSVETAHIATGNTSFNSGRSSSDDDFKPPFKPASLSRKSTMLSKPIGQKRSLSDDDFEQPTKRSHLSNNNAVKRKRSKKVRLIRKKNVFIDNEAVESDDDARDSSDGDNTSGLDEFEEDSFVNDFSQLNNTQIIQAKYIESKIKSPIYQFKQPQNRVPFLNVFSQLVPEESGSYMQDSFVNDEEEVQECELSALELAELELKRRQKEKRKRRREQGAKIATHSSSENSSDETKPRKKTRIKPIDSSSGDSEDDFQLSDQSNHDPDTHTVGKTVAGNTCQDHPIRNLTKKVDRRMITEEIESINNYNWEADDFGDASAQDVSKHIEAAEEYDWSKDFTVSAPNNPKIISMAMENDPLITFEKQAEISLPSVDHCSASRGMSNPTLKMYPLLGSSVKSSNTCLESNRSNTSPPLVLIVSNRQVAQASGVVTALKVTYNKKIMTRSVTDADFVLSWRVGIIRAMMSDFTVGKTQLLEAINGLRSGFQLPCVIVENNVHKPLCDPPRSGTAEMWSKRSATQLAQLKQAQVQVFFSQNEDNTARILAMLSEKEAQKGHKIYSASETMMRSLAKRLEFLELLPNVNTAMALKILQCYPKLASFISQSKIHIAALTGVPPAIAQQISLLLKQIC